MARPGTGPLVCTLLCMLGACSLTRVAGFSVARLAPVAAPSRPLAPVHARQRAQRQRPAPSATISRAALRRPWATTAVPMSQDDTPVQGTETLTADGFKTKSNMNAMRKIFHAVSGVTLAMIYELFLTRAQAFFAASVAWVVLTAVEIFRLKFAEASGKRGAVSDFLFGKFKGIARDYEREQLSGMVYYMAGISITVALFPKVVAVLAVLYLALGDPFASTVGIKYGKSIGPRFSNGKSLVGTLGGFAICALTTGLYLFSTLQASWTLAIVSLLGGVAAAVPETLCGRINPSSGRGGPIDVDDNLAVPIFSGMLLTAMLKVGFPHLL